MKKKHIGRRLSSPSNCDDPDADTGSSDPVKCRGKQ